MAGDVRYELVGWEETPGSDCRECGFAKRRAVVAFGAPGTLTTMDVCLRCADRKRSLDAEVEGDA